MKLSSIPKSGRKGSVVYVNSRHGKVARAHVRPRNPRTPEQQGQAMLAISPKAETFTCQVNPPPRTCRFLAHCSRLRVFVVPLRRVLRSGERRITLGS